MCDIISSRWQNEVAYVSRVTGLKIQQSSSLAASQMRTIEYLLWPMLHLILFHS